MDQQPVISITHHIQFASPPWLWLLVVIPLAFIAVSLMFNYKQHAIKLPLIPRLTRQPFQWSTHRYLIVPGLRVLALCLLCLALARPQLNSHTAQQKVKQLSIIIVLDLSNSMRAYDIKPTRLTAARNILSEFVKQRGMDTIGLVGFSGKAMTLMPMTRDHQALLEVLGQANTSMISIDGTAIGDALLTAANRLLQVKERDQLDHPGIVILATDGKNTQGRSPELAAEILANKNLKVYAIGLGGEKPVLRYTRTYQGELVPKRNIYGELEYWSSPDHQTLELIANKTNGRYFSASDKEKFEAIMYDIDQLERSEKVISHSSRIQELFLWPLLLSLMVLIIERLLSRLRYLDFT